MTSNSQPAETVFTAPMRVLLVLFFAFTTGVVALGLTLVKQPIIFVTDMQAMLPKQQVSSVQQRASDRLASQFSNNFILLLRHADAATLEAAASDLAATLATSEQIDIQSNADLEQRNQAAQRLLASHRFDTFYSSQYLL